MVPAGSSWRRIPFPAWCDLGSSCAVYNASVSGNKDKSNDTMSYTNGTPYGSCKTGLQFEAPHLKDNRGLMDMDTTSNFCRITAKAM